MSMMKQASASTLRFFIKDLHRFPRHHRTRAEHWEWLRKNNLYDYVMQNGGETFFDQLLENAKTYYSGISAEQACIVTAVDEYRKLIIKVPNIGKIDEKGVRTVLEGRLDQNDHLITDKLSSYESFAQMDNIPHTGIDSKKHTKDGYNLGMVNGLHKKIENFMPTSSERHTSTKYLEITLALFTLEWEMRGFSLKERAEHLRNFIHEHYAEQDESYEQIKKFKPEIDTKGFFDADKF